MCVVAVLLLLLSRVMIAMNERTAYCVRLGKVPPSHCRSLGIESWLADWAVFTELFVVSPKECQNCTLKGSHSSSSTPFAFHPPIQRSEVRTAERVSPHRTNKNMPIVIDLLLLLLFFYDDVNP